MTGRNFLGDQFKDAGAKISEALKRPTLFPLAETLFHDELTEEALAILTNPLVLLEKTKVEDWVGYNAGVAVGLVYFGLQYDFNDIDNPTPDAITVRLAAVTNELVKRGLIEYGVLCPPLVMTMVSTCTVCNKLYAVLSARSVEHDHKKCIEQVGTIPPPLKHRAMFLLYPASRYSREDLNTRLELPLLQKHPERKHFVEEGALPASTWPFGL